MNKSNPYTARRGEVGKVIIFLNEKHTYCIHGHNIHGHNIYGHTVRSVFCFSSFFLFWSFYPMIYVSPDISLFICPTGTEQSILSLTSLYIEMIHG